MTVIDLAMSTVRLSAGQVDYYRLATKQQNSLYQVTMMDRQEFRKDFSQLTLEDRDLTMFTLESLTLTKKETGNMVYMSLKLKRKVATELLTVV